MRNDLISDNTKNLLAEAETHLKGHPLIDQVVHLRACQEQLQKMENAIMKQTSSLGSLKKFKEKLQAYAADSRCQVLHKSITNLLEIVERRISICNKILDLPEPCTPNEEVGDEEVIFGSWPMVPREEFRKVEKFMKEILPYFDEKDRIIVKGKKFLLQELEQMERADRVQLAVKRLADSSIDYLRVGPCKFYMTRFFFIIDKDNLCNRMNDLSSQRI